MFAILVICLALDAAFIFPHFIGSLAQLWHNGYCGHGHGLLKMQIWYLIGNIFDCRFQEKIGSISLFFPGNFHCLDISSILGSQE